MNSILAYSTILTLVLPTIGRAQSETVPGPSRPEKVEHHGFSKVVFSQPARDLVFGAALTGLAFPLDNNIKSELTEGPKRKRVWTDIGNGYGNGIFLGAASAVTTGLGYALGNEDLRTTGTTLIKGLVVEMPTVFLLKHAITRERPDSTDSRSFPSGHSAGAFTVSTILARRYGWRMAIPAYALAATTACARMQDNRHFLSDVVAGAAIGFTIGEIVSKRPDHRERAIDPVVGANGMGFRLRF